MAQRLRVLQEDSDSSPVSISPIVRLARCVTTEETLEHLAEIVIGKGVTLLGIRLLRPGINREWRPQETFTIGTKSYEIEAHVEGGQTHIVLMLAGGISPDTCCEIESASHMAAQRIELCERKLWSGKRESAIDSTIELDGLIGSSEPMQALKRSIKSAAGCDSMTLIVGESGTGKELAARGIHNLSLRAR